MDFLVEFLIEILGGVIEFFFGEVPLKTLPRPIRFLLLFLFWFGLAALFGWFAYLAFATSRIVSMILFAVAMAAAAFGVYLIVKAMRKTDSELR